MPDSLLPQALVTESEAYLDALFGPGAGHRHTRFLARIGHPNLREDLHRCHQRQADGRLLSVEENYLLGMCVLYATHCPEPAGMFARTLLHLGVEGDKLLEAVARLAMWIGPIPAAGAAARLQHALDDYTEHGIDSMRAWFPGPDPLRRPADHTGEVNSHA
ncbi:hypothetical protein [Streptomyces lavendulae]|uniref:hypothetical protein n=1 Tax=Streptomyces lavendulae TaxID=1914 RepID=UPI0024A51E49|nr:hypothetical protein [Streptomyces lavendulae]GLW04060.1 hypothetical protein Slala05_76900 [Streptomyces lavendulae subsp. lavendulae]